MSKPKGCGGACCKRFILPYSPEQLEEQYRAWLVGSRNGTGFPVLQKRGTIPEDKGFGLPRNYNEEHIAVDPEIYLLYPMLVYLGEHHFEPCRPRKRTKAKAHHYTCKHWDQKTKLCTIYEHRPLMCRRFPNGEACPYPGCQLPGNTKKLKQQQSPSRGLIQERKCTS